MKSSISLPKRDHYLWYKLGINKSLWNTIIRQAVIKKFNNSCAYCGISNVNFDIHHTDYNDFTINSLIPLCRTCHRAEDNR